MRETENFRGKFTPVNFFMIDKWSLDGNSKNVLRHDLTRDDEICIFFMLQIQ